MHTQRASYLMQASNSNSNKSQTESVGPLFLHSSLPHLSLKNRTLILPELQIVAFSCYHYLYSRQTDLCHQPCQGFDEHTILRRDPSPRSVLQPALRKQEADVRDLLFFFFLSHPFRLFCYIDGWCPLIPPVFVSSWKLRAVSLISLDTWFSELHPGNLHVKYETELRGLLSTFASFSLFLWKTRIWQVGILGSVQHTRWALWTPGFY